MLADHEPKRLEIGTGSLPFIASQDIEVGACRETQERVRLNRGGRAQEIGFIDRARFAGRPLQNEPAVSDFSREHRARDLDSSLIVTEREVLSATKEDIAAGRSFQPSLEPAVRVKQYHTPRILSASVQQG